MNLLARFKEWVAEGSAKKDFINMWQAENPTIGKDNACREKHMDVAWELLCMQREIDALKEKINQKKDNV